MRPSSSTTRTHASAPLRGELRSWDTADGIQKLFTRFGKWSAKLDLKKVLQKPSPQLEFVFADDEFEIKADEGRKIAHRRNAFIEDEGFRGSVFVTMVTPHGVRRNEYWNNIQSEVTLDDLFKE